MFSSDTSERISYLTKGFNLESAKKVQAVTQFVDSLNPEEWGGMSKDAVFIGILLQNHLSTLADYVLRQSEQVLGKTTTVD